MNKLLVKFEVLFEDYNYDLDYRRFGPVFNRWLPNGIEDALNINFDNDTKLRLWFERKGEVRNSMDGKYVRFSYVPEHNLDPEIIPTQFALDGGKLYGMVEVDNVTKDQLEPIINQDFENAAYMRIGKKLVTKVVYPYVKRLQDILRVTYGQYWILPLEKWDSRESSLGYYCKQLYMKWSTDEGETWKDFIPNHSTVSIRGQTLERFKNEYITKDDWEHIGFLLREEYEPSLGARMLMQAHKRKDQGEYKYALIEAVTALEIAMEERIVLSIEDKKNLIDDIQNFWKLSMPAKLIIVSSLIGDVGTPNIPLQDLEDSIKAIHLRNKVAHEAKAVSVDSIKLIEALMKTISLILIDPFLKFPKMHLYKTVIQSPDF